MPSFILFLDRFKKNAIQTSGVVGENVKSESSTGYKTRYSYFDESGKEYFNTSSSSSNPPEYEVGMEIVVYYSKDNPAKSIYKSSTVTLITVLFFGLGIVSVIIGVILYIFNKDKEIVWEDSGLIAWAKNKKSKTIE